jgi:hypothetical protein
MRSPFAERFELVEIMCRRPTFWRLLGVALLVATVSASAYAVGRATRNDHQDLEKALAASSNGSHPTEVRPSRSSAAQRPSTPWYRSPQVNDTRATQQVAATKVDRDSVAVVVLNATTATGLARRASDALTARGFAPGFVGNDTRLRMTTAVSYAAGNRRSALEVAKVLRVKHDVVRPMDATTRSLAGADARVVLTLGSDRARTSR